MLEDLSLSPCTHVKSPVGAHRPVTPALRGRRQQHFWVLLADSLASDTVRHCFKGIKQEVIWQDTLCPPLASTHAPEHTCIHTTHKQISEGQLSASHDRDST